MNEPITVELLVDTNSNKKGDVRVLDPERAKAWIQAGWAKAVEKPRSRSK